MKRLFCILSAILICLHLTANERRLSFRHLSIEDGLSSMSVNDIWTDPSGVVWIATGVGLDCYDGNTISTQSPPPRDSSGQSVYLHKTARWQQ